MSERQFFDISPNADKSAVELEADIAYMISAFGEDRVQPSANGRGVTIFATLDELNEMFEDLVSPKTVH